jgi:hypothetical protein
MSSVLLLLLLLPGVEGSSTLDKLLLLSMTHSGEIYPQPRRGWVGSFHFFGRKGQVVKRKKNAM